MLACFQQLSAPHRTWLPSIYRYRWHGTITAGGSPFLSDPLVHGIGKDSLGVGGQCSNALTGYGIWNMDRTVSRRTQLTCRLPLCPTLGLGTYYSPGWRRAEPTSRSRRSMWMWTLGLGWGRSACYPLSLESLLSYPSSDGPSTPSDH